MASVVMLTVFVTAVSAVASTRGGIQGQYYSQLASDATESGLAMARACMDAGVDTWANPLRPGSSCSGAASQCTADNCYLSKEADIRVTFSVTAPEITDSSITVKAASMVERLRSSSGQVWRSYASNLQMELGRKDAGVGELMTWRQISVGGSHSCAIASNSQAYCWGYNGQGQLGDGNAGPGSSKNTPIAVTRVKGPIYTPIFSPTGDGYFF